MKLHGSSDLFKYEWDALKGALRRDIEREMEMAQADTPFLQWHLYNAHMSERLLNLMSEEEIGSRGNDNRSGLEKIPPPPRYVILNPC